MDLRFLRGATACLNEFPEVAAYNSYMEIKWQELAACTGMDTEIFYSPENIGGPRKGRGVIGERDRIELAKKICGTCSVRQECLKFAVQHKDDYGIYGGLTPQERRGAEHERQASMPVLQLRQAAGASAGV